MIPAKITSQVFFAKDSWRKTMAKIEEYWDLDYAITDIDYGGGYYAVVMSKGTGWQSEKILYGSSFPSEKVSKAWDDDYHITNVTFDGDDWIVIMSKVPECRSQTWFTRTGWNDFKSKISDVWDDDKVMTTISCKTTGTTVYFGAATSFKNSLAQSLRYISETPTSKEILGAMGDGKIVTDVHDVDGGVYVVTSSGYPYRRQYAVVGSLSGVSDSIDEGFDDGYAITTMAYYCGKWIMIMSK